MAKTSRPDAKRDVIPSDVLERAKKHLSAMALDQDRLIIAVAGPPGAGKSTVAEALAASLDHSAVLPMDGFHLDNRTLEIQGLLHRKGAPQTFDTSGLFELLTQARVGGAVSVPTFDRALDKVVPGGGKIEVEDRILVVEGNYLLLQEGGWARLHPFWDLTFMLDVSAPELERRLVKRWMDHGFTRTDAIRRAQENDLLNAETVRTQSALADVVLANG